MRNFAITERKLNELKPSARNARTHSRAQIKQIAAAIKEFGFTNPVLVDEEDRILAGHGRLAAAKLLGLKTIPTVRLSHLSEAQKRAYILADNRLAEKAGWDKAILAIELQHLVELDYQVELTGFAVKDISVVLDETGAGKPQHSQHQRRGREDALPKPRSGAVVSRRGDLWILGEHRLLCGDARDETAYSQLLAGERAQFILTDLQRSFTDPAREQVPGPVPMAATLSDAGSLSVIFAALCRHSIDGAIHQVFTDWRHLADVLQAGRAVYSELMDVCVWTNAAEAAADAMSFYRDSHELVLVFKSGREPHINNTHNGQTGRARSNVWDYAAVGGARKAENLAHRSSLLERASKPVRLLADAIADCSQPGALVLDPLGGSASVAIAAERTGRRARVLEREPALVDLALMRWQRYAGKSAVLSGSGMNFADVAQERLRQLPDGERHSAAKPGSGDVELRR